MPMPTCASLTTTSSTTSMACCRPCISAHAHVWQRASPCCTTRISRCAAASDKSYPSFPSSSSSSVRTLERGQDYSNLAVNVTLPTRQPPSTPRPVPVIHSAAYMQKEQGALLPYVNSDSEDVPPTALSISRYALPDPAANEGNLLRRTLLRVDRSLDELEHQPLPLQKEIYELSRGPVGQAAGQGLQTAAELTMKATAEAAKVAAPVGKWALANGTKAAVALVQLALVESAKAKERAKEKERREKGNRK